MTERKIHVALLDMTSAVGMEDEQDLILKHLKSKRFYKPDLLYRGFNGDRLETLMLHGNDNYPEEVPYCANEREWKRANLDGMDESPLDYATEFEKPALAVFNPKHMVSSFVTDLTYGYRLREASRPFEAVIAILKLKYNANH